MKAETFRDHREHKIKHILLIVANEGFVLWFNNTPNRMHKDRYYILKLCNDSDKFLTYKLFKHSIYAYILSSQFVCLECWLNSQMKNENSSDKLSFEQRAAPNHTFAVTNLHKSM
jgi:hypothetical protein